MRAERNEEGECRARVAREQRSELLTVSGVKPVTTE